MKNKKEIRSYINKFRLFWTMCLGMCSLILLVFGIKSRIWEAGISIITKVLFVILVIWWMIPLIKYLEKYQEITIDEENIQADALFKRKKIIIKKDRISSINIGNLTIGKKIYNIFTIKSKDGEEIILSGLEIKNISELTRAIGKKLPLSKIEKVERDIM
ncbi:hypothetical protein [Fusobacterium sp.]|uniref:hypothetical protein n=1 Tax=Fusobacterium sp. TaxID=68766 RepID=UPI002902004A|nr:hypothetical protein [Fusobacterium sp.]MDU1911723.1 hypothetical protein [Fusobacterium sp.]